MCKVRFLQFALASVLASICVGAMSQAMQTYQAQVARTLSPDEQQVLLLVNESAALLDQGNAQAALTTANRALVLARSTKMRDLEALSLHNLARVEFKAGQRDLAIRLMRQALLLNEIEGNLGAQGTVRLDMAEMLSGMGQQEESQKLSDSARKISAVVGDKLADVNSASMALRNNRSSASAGSRQADGLLELSRAAGMPIAEATALRKLGRQALEVADFSLAQRYFEQALARASTALNPEAEAQSLMALGELAAERRKPAEAIELYERAVAKARKGKSNGAAGNALLKSALAYGQLEDVAAMRRQALLAQEDFKADGQKVGLGLVSEALGDAEWMQGRRREAEELYRYAVQLGESTRSPLNEANARLKLASLLRPVSAQAALVEGRRAMEIYKAAELKSGVAQSLYEIGRIYGASNDFGKALSMVQESRDAFSRINMHDKVAMADLMLAGAQRFNGNLPEALLAAKRATAGYSRVDMASGEARAQQEEAEIFALMGDMQSRDSALRRASMLARKGGSAKAIESVRIQTDRMKAGG